MSPVLVTGATGFLGGALVRALVRSGVEVIATGRDAARLAALPLAEPAKLALDLGDPGARLPLSGISAVVHCAALSSAWGSEAAFHRANVTGTETALRLAAQLGAEHFVHISTPAVYFRFRDQLQVAEDMPLPKPVNAYARTKTLAEARVRSSGLPFTILRPRGIYGPGDTALLPRLLRAAQSGPLPRFRGARVVTDITHVDDAVAAILAVLLNPKAANGRTFNISGGEALAIGDIVQRVAALHGLKPRWRTLPVGPALLAVTLAELVARLRPGQPEPRVTRYGLGIFAYSQTLDLTLAQKHLGWSPQVSFTEGLQRSFPELPR